MFCSGKELKLFSYIPGAVFVNGTPTVIGTNVFINFVKTGTFVSIDCTLKGPGKSVPITSSCKSEEIYTLVN